MMKTLEELNAIKAEVEAVNKKLAELTEEELKQVTGGSRYMPMTIYCEACGRNFTADISQDIVQCPNCGHRIDLYG